MLFLAHLEGLKMTSYDTAEVKLEEFKFGAYLADVTSVHTWLTSRSKSSSLQRHSGLGITTTLPKAARSRLKTS